MRALKSKKLLLGGLACLCFIAVLNFVGCFHPRAITEGPRLKPFRTLNHSAMAEISGLVLSETNPSLLWAHNDSGNEPRLFALTQKGDLVGDIALENTTLNDWEDMALSGETLYIGEMGNNLNAGKALGVYEFTEPEPKTKTHRPTRFIKVRYPDQTGFPPTDRWHFDCEAMFCWNDSLYFVTKNRPAFRVFVQEGSANLYRLDLKNLKDDNVLEAVDSIKNLGGWVTAADISPDGRRVVILCESPLQSIWMFERPEQGHRFFTEPKSVKRFVFHGGGQLETLAFAEHEGEEVLLLMNEQQEMFRIGLDLFQPVSP